MCFPVGTMSASDQPGSPESATISPWQVAFFALLFPCILAAVALWRGLPLLPEGPSYQIARQSISLWETGSVVPATHMEIYNHLKTLTRENHSFAWQDIFAVRPDGSLFPKHTPILSILASPFFGIFGTAGFWILNQCFLFALTFSMYRITSRLYGPVQTIPFLALLYTGTQLLFFSYGISPDLFGVFLVICGLDLLHHRPLWGGLMLGLSLFVRPLYIVMIPFLTVAWSKDYLRSQLLDAIAGTAAAICIYMAWNWAIWGGPFTTVYDRFCSFENGEVVYLKGSMIFDWKILASNWK